MSEVTIVDKLLKPFYKVHVSDLISSEKVGEGQWSVKAVGGEGQERLVCSMVWLQAEVVTLNIPENWLEVVEGGSKVRVVSISSSPGGVDWIQEGQFVQVLGQVTTANNKVLCTKIVNLDNKKLSRANSKQLWDLEVSELHKVLTRKIKIRGI